MALISAETAFARAIAAPDVPADRVAALRRAFDAARKDPRLLAEAAQQSFDISPARGEKAQEVVADMEAGPDVVVRAKRIVAAGGEVTGDRRSVANLSQKRRVDTRYLRR